jgi:hypothetical protein
MDKCFRSVQEDSIAYIRTDTFHVFLVVSYVIRNTAYFPLFNNHGTILLTRVRCVNFIYFCVTSWVGYRTQATDYLNFQARCNIFIH